MPETGPHDLATITPSMAAPTVLFQEGDHRVYWLGIPEETVFRCNTYLICDGDEALLVDPGSRLYRDQVRDRVAQILPPEQVTGLIINHQDPDVAATLPDWLALNPDLAVYTTPRTDVLVRHLGTEAYRLVDVEEHTEVALPSGAALRFIPAPFLHAPGAFATLDTHSDYLFSGDVWAALDMEWTLVVTDFEAHRPSLDLFNQDYMASNIAARGFVHRLRAYTIRAILPQHGSIIGPDHVAPALDYLAALQCGTDLIYPHLERQ